MGQHFEVIVERIHDRDPRYREGAYLFVMEAMSYTQRKYGRPATSAVKNCSPASGNFSSSALAP